MNVKQAFATLTLAAVTAGSVPAPAMADGAASTRNILLGVGAATYLIIQHNRKVHERYAEDARRQSALEQENNNTMAAYRDEVRAYNEQVAVNASLKREIAYQHSVVEKQRHQLALLNVHQNFVAERPSQPMPRRRAAVRIGQRRQQDSQPSQLAMVSYGWGTL